MGRSHSARAAIVVAALTFVTASLGSPLAASALPIISNDNFADAQALTGPRGSVTGNSTDATMELGEWTFEYGTDDAHSVWFRWTAPATRWVSFDSCASSSIVGSFDTILAAFTFATPGDWTGEWDVLDESDDRCSGNKSVITFLASVGTTYYVQVTGYFGSSYGPFRLSWRTGPTRDSVLAFLPAPAPRCDPTLDPRDPRRGCPPNRGRR